MVFAKSTKDCSIGCFFLIFGCSIYFDVYNCQIFKHSVFEIPQLRHLSCPCHSQQKDGLPCRHNPPEPKRDFSGIACFTWLHPESQLERKVKESNVWRFSAQIGLGKPQAVVNCAAHLFNPYLKHVQELLQTHGLHESSAIQRCSSKQPEILSTIFYLRKLHNRNAFASGPGTMWSPVGHEPLPS